MWSEMVQGFESMGLPVPPVPAALRPRLLAHGSVCWATREITGFDMYFWTMAEAEEVLAGRASEYVAVSHSGHGVNSYAVTYHLVYRGLALFMQEAWGGIYMDNHAQAAKLADMFDRCAGLVGWCERQPSDRPPERWLLCLDSRMRGTSACGWVPASGVDDGPTSNRQWPAIVAGDGRVPPGAAGYDAPLQRFLRGCAVDEGTALAHAEHLLS
jgi:hypothetical protein